MKINTLIVGLGKIGMKYNYYQRSHYNNHCESISFHKKFNLVGGVDVNLKNKDFFIKKYKLPFFKDIVKANKKLKPEMIIISIPTDKTNKLFNLIKKEKILPKIFLLEKPGSYDYKSLKSFLSFCKKHNVKIFINYTRSFSKFSDDFINIIKRIKFGKINKIEIFYHKGIFNSCGHYINFIFKIFNTTRFSIDSIFKNIKFKKDFLSNFLLKIKYPIYFFYEMQNKKEKIIFYGSNKKIIYYTESSRIYYYNNEKLFLKNDLMKNLKNTLDYIIKNKTNNFNVISSLKTLEIISKITNKIK